MRNKFFNFLLLIAFIVPIIFLFWPFAQWSEMTYLALRIIPSVSAQVLLCRIGKNSIIKTIPLMVTAGIALWGIYLALISPDWKYATVGNLFCDYISMFICCIFVYCISRINRYIL